MAPTKPRYRDFLTPALHRRFTSASLYTLSACYAIAVWMGEGSFLWKWLPVGPAGIRTLLLFISALSIYILRVSQMHIGERTTTVPFETFTKYLLRWHTLQTLAFYIFSAWWYSEVFIYSQPTESKLGWIDAGKYHERIRLNERPIYLRFLFLCLAIAQSAIHLFADYDRIAFPVLKARKGVSGQNTSPVVPAATQLKSGWLVSLNVTVMTTVVTLFGGSILYFVFLRLTLWDWYFSVARHLFSLGKTGKPGGVNFPTIWWSFVTQGFFLVNLWRFTNKAFDAYVGQEPLKNGKPITDDSKDPNGSLLNGLKAKKEVPRNVAFWELVLITTRFDDRRKTIYQELGRDNKEDSTWSKIRNVCLAEIKGITDRIEAVQSPKADPDTVGAPPVVDLVPRISQPLREGQIVTRTPPKGTRSNLEKIASDLVKTKSPPPGSSPRGVKLLDFGNSLMAKSGMTPSNHPAVKEKASDFINNFIHSPAGIPFRRSFLRTVTVVVAGTPFSHAGPIADAATALAGLVACSLKEDTYGRVQKDVPDIIRAFVAAIKKIDAFVTSLNVHWTDKELVMGKINYEEKDTPEVKEVVEALRDGLEKILLAWVEFLDTCGLTRAEVREAKLLAGGERGR
ncbi:hypothetical protein BU16DRAFT_517152 [Lophium mytilinum]|uniref:Nuclear envelope protein n=1 Tax=Lophium mytilinum TaxID=390894 RepID=A0A6A6QHH7_9PEZI|nr:hypothetical protein BU16DRAFT_517152 [Lophium mytilinum]